MLVEVAEAAPEGDAMTLSLVIRPASVSREEGRLYRDGAPERLPDLQAFGDGEADDALWYLCPDLEHLQIFEEVDNEEAPRCWWAVNLWVHNPASMRGSVSGPPVSPA